MISSNQQVEMENALESSSWEMEVLEVNGLADQRSFSSIKKELN